MMPTIYRDLVVIGITFILGVLAGFIPEYGHYVSYRAKIEQKAQDQSVNAKEINQSNQDLSTRTQSEYQDKLDHANARIAALLRMHNSSTCSVPKQTDAASGIVAVTPDPLPDYRKLATDCTKTTVMLVELQKFNRESK